MLLLVGQPCRLDTTQWSAADTDSLFAATVSGVIIGERRHVEDSARVLYYFRTTGVEYPAAAVPGGGGGAHLFMGEAGHYSAGGTEHWNNRLAVAPRGFTSTAGYRYRFDGWYDDLYLYPTDGEAVDPVPAEWLLAMELAPAACELRLLCYALRPWFASPFEDLKYLALPERDACYSVHVCHRCLSPFFSQRQLTVHLEGYCDGGAAGGGADGPPGVLLYADDRGSDGMGLKVLLVDGAQHMHYCRCLSLLGKCFLESKLLANDVDIYEFYVVTLPRGQLPYVPGGDAFEGETQFRAAASGYDAAGWSGRVVAGYFSRLKHSPHHTLSCIVTFPIFQQRRLASFMLDLAYALTAERQQRCGCRRYCGARRADGGAISRPFSPHGQALLVAYWRAALVRTLWTRELEVERAAPEGEGSGVTAPSPPEGSGSDREGTKAADDGAALLRFPSLKALAAAMPILIALDDLRFLLINDDFAFYAPVADRAKSGAGGGKDGPAFQLSLVFDKARTRALFAAEEERNKTASPSARAQWYFRPECLLRRPSGSLVYGKSLFHY